MKLATIALWTSVSIVGLSPLVVAGLAMGQDSYDREVVRGPAGTALAMALRAAGVATGSSYDVDGAWKALDASQITCDDPGFVRWSYCSLINERGYPDRTLSVHREKARALMTSLLEVSLVSTRFPWGDHLDVERIACIKRHEEEDFTCVVDVR